MTDSTGKKLLSAKEMQDLFGISEATFYRILARGPSKTKNRGLSLDLRRIPSRYVGSRRFWSKTACDKLLRGMI